MEGGRTSAEAERRSARKPKAVASAERVVGGHVPVRAWLLVAAWSCYHEGLIQLRTLRVWFALLEMGDHARRCQLEKGRRPRYSTDEIRGLVGGVGGKHLARDVRQLVELGLVKRTEAGRLCFPTDPQDVGVLDELDGFWETVTELENDRRTVPVPRRVVRFLAGCGTRVLFATTFGLMLRLLYWKRGELNGRGRIKASWVEATFGVDQRGVKRARKHLEEIGLVVAVGEGTSQERFFERRWGKLYIWNLAWGDAELVTDSPPVSSDSTPGLPPVRKKQETPPTEESLTQKPAERGPQSSGISSKKGERAPSWFDIVEHDLTDDERTLGLFEDARRRGVFRGPESDELKRQRFFGLIEHARRYGTRNRPGLVRRLVETERWSFVTIDEERIASARIKRVLFGTAERTEERPPERSRPSLSDDAQFVRALRGELRRRGFRGDVAAVLERERPDWTRERWQRAELELRGGAARRFGAEHGGEELKKPCRSPFLEVLHGARG